VESVVDAVDVVGVRAGSLDLFLAMDVAACPPRTRLGHLTTARAAGVPGRISLSSRLQFLVAQTDVSGIWVRPRRTRFTVYLAGIAVNLAVAATAILLLAAVDPVGLPRRLLAATTVLSLVMIPFQLMVFMRTDLYFLIQDLTGADNQHRKEVTT
jgi:putative peptide zinc metalloprotease protein